MLAGALTLLLAVGPHGLTCPGFARPGIVKSWDAQQVSGVVRARGRDSELSPIPGNENSRKLHMSLRSGTRICFEMIADPQSGRVYATLYSGKDSRSH